MYVDFIYHIADIVTKDTILTHKNTQQAFLDLKYQATNYIINHALVNGILKLHNELQWENKNQKTNLSFANIKEAQSQTMWLWNYNMPNPHVSYQLANAGQDERLSNKPHDN